MTRTQSLLSLFAALTSTNLSASAAMSQVADTSQWQIEENAAWNFDVSIPPGWTIYDIHIGNLRLTVGRDISGGRKLMCQVFANSEPRTGGLTQGKLNDLISGAGPSSPRDLGLALSDATGHPTTIYATSLEWVNGLPAYVYDGLMRVQSSTAPIVERIIFEKFFVAGRDYGLSCHAASQSVTTSSETYDEYLATFRGFLRSFLVYPPVTD